MILSRSRCLPRGTDRSASAGQFPTGAHREPVLGGLAHRPTAGAGRGRGRTRRFRIAPYASAIERYMQNTLALAPVIAKASSFGSSAAKGLVGMIDGRDVAAVAAGIAASPAPPAGRTHWLSGPELISNYDVANVLSRLLGRTITYRELSYNEDKNAMVSAVALAARRSRTGSRT
jgi:hypothetical protein